MAAADRPSLGCGNVQQGRTGHGGGKEQPQHEVADGSAEVDEKDNNARRGGPLESRLLHHKVDELVKEGREHEGQAEA